MFGQFSYNFITNDMEDLTDEDVEIYNYADDNTVMSSSI